MRTFSEEELKQDPNAALKAARKGLIFLTKKGKTTHVLMSFKEYLRLTGKTKDSFGLVGKPETVEVEVDSPSPGG